MYYDEVFIDSSSLLNISSLYVCFKLRNHYSQRYLKFHCNRCVMGTNYKRIVI